MSEHRRLRQRYMAVLVELLSEGWELTPRDVVETIQTFESSHNCVGSDAASEAATVRTFADFARARLAGRQPG